ncbi:photosystem II assembly protein Psb34 [Calothrix sp. PCC 6303]|uniref:photosystem II assembly protein Psb34 n=1 Tax=Calothrix sp. PCC 6303 TaxID=1170562 RepID=UPI0002A03A1A|nr:ssl1498 family light-harvesting-like protein [Calothrix sp. PCC 6303]AFZ00793.1 hypothetical protein Cal6303_1755 [Calothrix sp. PCC 6303]
MPYINEENGLLNNFAREPKVYHSEARTVEQKRNLMFMSVGTSVLVGALIAIAYAVSSIG